jgi:hypothetical protein
MTASKIRRVIARDDNVLLVDFGRGPQPPAPRFPGASGLRATRPEDCQLRAAPMAAREAA